MRQVRTPGGVVEEGGRLLPRRWEREVFVVIRLVPALFVKRKEIGHEGLVKVEQIATKR